MSTNSVTVPASTGMVKRPSLVLTADEAVSLIADGATIAVGGSGSLLQVPETLLKALGNRYRKTSTPRDLTAIHVMGLGDHTGRGTDHLAQEGLVRRFIGSHFVLSPHQQRMIASGKVEAIGLPAGTVSQLYRETAAQRPGLFTDIGLGTFVDPRQEWGRMNKSTQSGLSELVEINGEEYLFYPRQKIDVALLRGSEVDECGNVSMDDEAGSSDNLAIAQAAYNSGGIVLVEVKRQVAGGSIPAGRVRVPGALVTHAVISDWENQTPITVEDPRRTGVSANRDTSVPELPVDHRKIVARRAAEEIRPGDIANLGVGMANGISYVALEEGTLNDLNISIEQGIFGGVPGVGLDSGTAVNPSAIVDMTSQLDFYDGGGLDFAGLAFAQIDSVGNVNVARVGSTPIGPGGFIDISQKARTVVFCGTLCGGDLQTSVADESLTIVREGRYRKLVDRVDSITFNADRARSNGQRVFYVTERAVFRLIDEGVELIEVAPGIDLQKDVLDQMGFAPVIREEVKRMESRLFKPGRIGLKLV